MLAIFHVGKIRFYVNELTPTWAISYNKYIYVVKFKYQGWIKNNRAIPKK